MSEKDKFETLCDALYSAHPELEEDIEKLKQRYNEVDRLLDLWLKGDENIADKTWSLLEDIRNKVELFGVKREAFPIEELKAVRLF